MNNSIVKKYIKCFIFACLIFTICICEVFAAVKQDGWKEVGKNEKFDFTKNKSGTYNLVPNYVDDNSGNDDSGNNNNGNNNNNNNNNNSNSSNSSGTGRGGGGGGGGAGAGAGGSIPFNNFTEVFFFYDTDVDKWLLIDMVTGTPIKGIVDVVVEVDSTRVSEIQTDPQIGISYMLDKSIATTSNVKLDYAKDNRLYKAVNSNLDKDNSLPSVVSLAAGPEERNKLNDTNPVKSQVTLTYCLDDATGYMYEGWKVFNGNWYFFLDARKYGYMLKEVEYRVAGNPYIFDRYGKCINFVNLPGWYYNEQTDTWQYLINDLLALDYDYKSGFLYAYDALTTQRGDKRYGWVLVHDKEAYFDPALDGACYVGKVDTYLLGDVEKKLEMVEAQNQYANAIYLKHKNELEEQISLRKSKTATNPVIDTINKVIVWIKNLFSVGDNTADKPRLTTKDLGLTNIKEGGFHTLADGKLCYIVERSNGAGQVAYEPLVGLAKIDNSYYYFDETGRMQTGLKTVEGNLYYFAEDAINYGKLLIGYVTVNGQRYYCDPTTGGIAVKVQ